MYTQLSSWTATTAFLFPSATNSDLRKAHSPHLAANHASPFTKTIMSIFFCSSFITCLNLADPQDMVLIQCKFELVFWHFLISPGQLSLFITTVLLQLMCPEFCDFSRAYFFATLLMSRAHFVH